MHATLTSLLSATGRRGGGTPVPAIPWLASFSVASINSLGGPLLQMPTSTFARTGSATVEDYSGAIVPVNSGEIRIKGARRVDHADGHDYGYNSLGIEYRSDDAGGSPLGTDMYMMMEQDATNLAHPSTGFAGQTITVVSGSDYTISFYGTGSITYSGAASGTLNGTGASDLVYVNIVAGSTSLVLDAPVGSVDYVQVELNKSGQPSSRIITTTAAVSRGAEDWRLSPTFATSKMTTIINYSYPYAQVYSWQNVLFYIFNSGDSNRRILYRTDTGYFNVKNGTDQASGYLSGSTWVGDAVISARAQANSFKLDRSDGETFSDTAGSFPTGLNSMQIGASYNALLFNFNGGVREFRLIDDYLDDTTVAEQLTALASVVGVLLWGASMLAWGSSLINWA